LTPVTERLRQGTVIELEISDLAATGKSVGRHNGMVVMADGGLPGELVECEISKVKRSFAFARVSQILRPSDRRINPRCRHFEICGGCTWQDLEYDDQLTCKAKFVADGLTRIAKLTDVVIDPPVRAGEPFYYRNKMEYSFGSDDQRPTAGLHIKGRFDAIFELQECFLQSERSVAALETVKRTARNLNIPFYDYNTGEGELRFLVVREGKLTDDLMLNVVTFNRDFEDRDNFFDEVQSSVDGLTSLFQTVNGRKANVVVGEELIHISGKTEITERIGDLIFLITPFSFFQTNSRQAKVLYDVIIDHANPQPEESLLDLFCGCGSIGLYLAGKVKSVLGIEINEESIEMAKANTELNGIDNADFRAGDVRRMLVDLQQAGTCFDTIIADPPRAGLEQTAVRRLARLNSTRIVAVSCNPATLARDLALFVEHGYRVERVTPVDMFPQTAHIEAVATLTKQ
jgi:23S rRNA (uracil1939-C5)-methyltransferase